MYIFKYYLNNNVLFKLFCDFSNGLPIYILRAHVYKTMASGRFNVIHVKCIQCACY